MAAATPTLDMIAWYTKRTVTAQKALSEIHAELTRLAYAAGDLESEIRCERPCAHEKALQLIGRLQDLGGVTQDAIASDSRAVHEWAHGRTG